MRIFKIILVVILVLVGCFIFIIFVIWGFHIFQDHTQDHKRVEIIKSSLGYINNFYKTNGHYPNFSEYLDQFPETTSWAAIEDLDAGKFILSYHLSQERSFEIGECKVVFIGCMPGSSNCKMIECRLDEITYKTYLK